MPGPTTLNSSSGITCSNPNANLALGGNTSTLDCDLIISSAATLGARTLTLHTNGTDTNGATFTVLAPPLPTLIGISPTSGKQGDTVPVTLTGTNMTGATINALSGITFSSVSSASTTV